MNSDTSEQQFAQIRQYMLDKAVELEVIADGGDMDVELEVAEVIPALYTEREQAELGSLFGNPVSQLRDLGVL